jgi:glycosyltransferase involved in cell wall biosynthesis
VALNQCTELVRRGHDVTLAAATRGYPVPPTELNGVPVRLFDTRTVLPGAGFPGVSAPGMAKWFRDSGAEFDVVHLHFGRHLVVMPVALAARRRRMPYVLQTHGMVIPSRHPLAGPLDLVWTRKLLRHANAVFYLTEQEREHLVEVARAPLRLIELGNGVPDYGGVLDDPVADRGPGPPEVLFVARMHERKRPGVFVDMAKALLAEGVNARFTLVGPDEGEGATLRTAMDGEPRISWEGPVNPDDIPRRMAQASVYVLPSVREPYPMTVLEAMSAGLPVVVSADCGLAPLVDRARCGIVTEGEAPQYASAVKALLADRGLAIEMGLRARETALERFSMSAIGDRLLNTYTDVLGSR